MSPRVTFAVLAFEQEAYIEEAIAGAFAQDFPSIEIILSDDCSTDRTYSLMRQMADRYSGPHVVRHRRNEYNMGIGAHINSVMQIASGDLLVAAAGDDIALPGRTRRLVAEWEATGRKADLLCSAYYGMSELGELQGEKSGLPVGPLALETVARYGHGVVGATEAWTRRLWNRFGDLPAGTVNEDQVLTFRALLLGGILYVDEPLVQYRQGVSKWIERGEAGRVELQRRNTRLARFSAHNARVARADALELGRADLLPLLNARIAEAELIALIQQGRNPSLGELFAGIRAGARATRVGRALLRTRVPLLHEIALKARRLRNSM